MAAKTKNKAPAVQKVIHEAIHLMESCGLPLSGKTLRGREKSAMSFLAVAGVSHSAAWPSAGQGPPLRTREIIQYINKWFQENISEGSYDDIRRKDLADALLAGLVIPSAHNPAAAMNDPTRGYALSPEFRLLVRQFGQKGWAAQAAEFMAGRPSLAERLAQKASFDPVPVVLPGGKQLSLSSGTHNLLQKAVVEQFLPRFGSGSQVIYLGDTALKTIHADNELAARLGLVLDPAAKIPDIIAWCPSRDWLFLIEAVHSFGPISNKRKIVLEKFAEKCTAGLVFVTAFLDMSAFRKSATDIGWDTEVWIAAEPDHLIHWNGDRFMGPRPKEGQAHSAE